MGALDGRVIIITGAGRGLGREYALLCASQGARVVVNDLGGAADGSGTATGPAADVVAEILASGGDAVANTEDVSSWEGAERLVQTAVDAFGRLDVLVNNAGILRDTVITRMTEAEWDAVIQVHLKGHFCALRAAAMHWRERSKGGEAVDAAIINTASPSGLTHHNVGQVNYGAAKAGIAAMTMTAALELGRLGVTVNAIGPRARTRLTEATPGLEAMMAPPSDPDAYDGWDPANHAPLIAFLAAEGCDVTGEVFEFGRKGEIYRLAGWTVADELLHGDGPPTAERMAAALDAVKASASV